MTSDADDTHDVKETDHGVRLRDSGSLIQDRREEIMITGGGCQGKTESAYELTARFDVEEGPA